MDPNSERNLDGCQRAFQGYICYPWGELNAARTLPTRLHIHFFERLVVGSPPMARTRSGRRKRSRTSQPRTPSAATSPITNARQRAARDRALHALALMRKGESMSSACRAEHIKPDTFRRYVGSAVRHDKPGGRFRVTKTDALRRELQVHTAEGPVNVTAKGIKAAREFSAHANAIAHFNRTGDTSRLKRFKGRTFTASGRRYEFLTNPDTLMELAEADALRLDSLYASVATTSRS
jgi:hypothetical protein